MSLAIEALALLQVATQVLRTLNDDGPAVALRDGEGRLVANGRGTRVGVLERCDERAQAHAAMVGDDSDDEGDACLRDTSTSVGSHLGVPLSVGPFLFPRSLAAVLPVGRMRGEVGAAPLELRLSVRRVVLRRLPLDHGLHGVGMSCSPGRTPFAVVDLPLSSALPLSCRVSGPKFRVCSALTTPLTAVGSAIERHVPIVAEWLTYRATVAA